MKFLVPLGQVVLVLLAGGLAVLGGAAMPGKTDGNPPVVIASALGCIILLFLATRPAPAEKRRGQLAFSGCVVFGCFVLVAILAPVFYSARAAASQSSCMSSVKQLVLGVLMYSGDHDDRLPLAKAWRSSIAKYEPAEPGGFRCRQATTPYSYALNAAVAGRRLEDIEDMAATAMIFEANAYGPNASGDSQWFARPHHKMGMIGFVEGRAKLIGDLTFNDVRWNP